MKSKIFAVMCAGLLSAGVASANGDLKAEIADLKAKVASMESARMAPAAGGDCASLTSMKKKGNITIGGKAEVDVVVVQRERMNAPTTAIASPAALQANTSGQKLESGDRTNTTYFGTGLPYDSAHGAYLDFKIDAGCDTYLYIKLDLDDLANGAGNDDLLEEVYFAWNKVRGSAFDLRFGKKNVDYGQDKYAGITPSFHDGWAYWLTAYDANGTQDQVGTNSLPTGLFNMYQIEAIYHWKDLVNVYATVFQNNRGMTEDRSQDSLLFDSYALKAEFMPLEGLTLSASWLNQHQDSGSERTTYPAGVLTQYRDAENDQYAYSLAADYVFKSLPLNLWGEYQHGFDWGYNTDVSTDTIGIGATYGLNKNIDLSILTEYANIENANPLNAGNGSLMGSTAGLNGYVNPVEDEDYYQVVLTGTYKFENGLYMTLEYAHQWYDAELGQGFNDEERDADMIGFRTGFDF